MILVAGVSRSARPREVITHPQRRLVNDCIRIVDLAEDLDRGGLNRNDEAIVIFEHDIFGRPFQSIELADFYDDYGRLPACSRPD